MDSRILYNCIPCFLFFRYSTLILRNYTKLHFRHQFQEWMKYPLKHFCILYAYIYIYDYIFNKYKDTLINYLRYFTAVCFNKVRYGQTHTYYDFLFSSGLASYRLLYLTMLRWRISSGCLLRVFTYTSSSCGHTRQTKSGDGT